MAALVAVAGRGSARFAVSGTASAEAGKKRAGIGLWFLRIAGIALLAWVLWNVGWHDSVTLLDESRITGEIVGEIPRTVDPPQDVALRLADGTVRTFRTTELRVVRVEDAAYPDVSEGILRIVGKSDKWKLALGALMFGAISHFGVWRWWILLRAVGVRVSFWTAHRLTFIGFFFNNVVPGATGGDVVKAVYVARGAQRRAPAVMTVLLDRLLGLLALALIAFAVVLTRLDETAYRQLSWFVFAFLGAAAFFAFVFLSRRARAVLRIETIVAKLPGGGLLGKIDQAIFEWRSKRRVLQWALLLSFANQLGIQVMMWTLAAGLHITTRSGEPVPIPDLMVVLPVAFIVSAIPAMPGGWGVREAAFAFWFHYVGVDRGPAVALSIVNGLVQLLWSVPGGAYFLAGRAAGEFTESAADVEANAESIVGASGAVSGAGSDAAGDAAGEDRATPSG